MNTRFVFGFVVLASCGIIYGVHYQREQERIFMRRGVIKELEEYRESEKFKKKTH